MNFDNSPSLEPGEIFWGIQTLEKMLRLRFDEHLCKYVHSCFKKGPECCFLFLFLAWVKTTRIYEGHDSNNKQQQHGKDSKNKVERHTLNVNISVENRFVIEPERPQECQFMNTHSFPMSNILNCNTNVQAGDSGQHSTNHCSIPRTPKRGTVNQEIHSQNKLSDA